MVPLRQYAADTLFFMEGTIEMARRTAILVELFGAISGLETNHAKSSYIPFGMAEEAAFCAMELLTPITSLLIMYMDLPLLDPHIGSRGWIPVVEWTERRL